MLVLHRSLMTAQKERKDLARSVVSMSEQLATLKQINAALEREVERYQQRQLLLERAKLVKQKLAWMRVAMKSEEKDEANEQLKAQLQKLVALKEGLSSAEEAHEVGEQIKECKEAVARLRAQQKAADTARMNAYNKAQKLSGECAALDEEIKSASEAREASERKIANFRNEISKLEKKIVDLPDPKNTAPELASTVKMIEALSIEIRKAQEQEKQLTRVLREKDTALAQKRDAYGRLENDRKVREERFRSQHSDLYNLLRWARDNAQRFRGRVAEPIALDITPESEVAAQRLEQLIPKNVMTTFVVENNDDMEMMRKQAQEMRIYGFNAFIYRGNMTEESLAREIPCAIDRDLKSAGVMGWACETFSAPLSLRGALFTLHPALWKTMFAERPVAVMEKVQKVPGAMGLMDGQTHFQFKRSRYGNRDFSVSTSRYNGADRARLLSCGTDPAKRELLQRELAASEAAYAAAKEQANGVADSLKSLLAERRQLEARKDELSNIPKARQAIQSRIEQKRVLIRDEEATDHEEEARKAQAKMAKVKEQLARALRDLAPPLKTMLEASLELDGETMRLLDLEDHLARLEDQLEQEKSALKAAEKELQAMKGASSCVIRVSCGLLISSSTQFIATR